MEELITTTTDIGKLLKTTGGVLAMSEGQQESLAGIAAVRSRIEEIEGELNGLYDRVCTVTSILYGESSDVEPPKATEAPGYSFTGEFGSVCLCCDRILGNIRKTATELVRFNT